MRAGTPPRSTRTPRRALDILRFEGIAGFWFRSLAALGYRREAWLERNLDIPVEAVAPPADIVLRELGSAEREAYLGFRPGATAKQFDARLARGCRCHVASRGQRILAATWTFEGRGLVEHLGRPLELDDDQVYLFNSYTAPEARGSRCHGALAAKILAEYRDRGFRSAVTMVEPHNRSGMRSRHRSGFRRTGTVIRLRVGPWRWELARGRTESRVRGQS
jgi:ribosomal protein S18 acetylase RimI-like enzyme